MIDSVQGGLMPAGTCIVSRNPQKNPGQILRERAEQRKIVREEMRYNELTQKAKTGELTQEEKAELKLIKTNRLVEKLVLQPTVMYIA